ncbi:MAG: hypothetical protein IPP94_13945 [Ignavibacteria bacterium]|nr:hypothetical protein [Ignavibacteria bacterium]
MVQTIGDPLRIRRERSFQRDEYVMLFRAIIHQALFKVFSFVLSFAPAKERTFHAEQRS